MSQTKQIEEKWRLKWEEARIFEANPDNAKTKLMVTFPYPYMNGPLHVGHTFTATRVDAYARFKRMQGFNVLWPWAWHWTGQPLLGASGRVAKGDEAFIRVLRDVDGVPEKDLKRFIDPLYMAQYYTNEGRKIAKRIGFSIDWRREFTTVMPTYQRFIEWQYENLREKGYVTRGTHPVVWCPKDKSPTGDHDRQVGEGVTPEEYILIKYKLDDETFLPAATFRPETIYGVTNMWINPDAEYVEAIVNGEKWIVSKEAAEKLKEQEREVEVKKIFKGRELVGKTFTNPVTKEKFPILPGWFVDSKTATGVVYSVPAHAPYDWLALKDLQEKPESLCEFGVDAETVKEIKPISIIEVEGCGQFPAVDIVREMGIRDQYDPKADEATKALYKKEFHGGILKDNCGPYAKKTVREAKDILITDFRQQGYADSMYDLPEAVVCRCMTPCIVKVLSDQWFLNYNDSEWKSKAKQVVTGMQIYPETARQWFITVIDWLKEWACARTTGFGTPLPWGKGWIVETLSDSTIYMSFYTINKHIREREVKPEALTRSVFDYIFYGRGDCAEISNTSGIPAETLRSMRNEFLYWYPFDLRVSAKELVPNHLTFCIFHHAALFPSKHWPRAMGVNGMLMIEGKQMHKSKGNFITMKGAVDRYGADATRCALLLGAEGMDDPDWRGENASDVQSKLQGVSKFCQEIIVTSKNTGEEHLERWLLSKLQQRITLVTSSLDEMKTRTALQVALFEIWNDLRWYIQRKSKADSQTLLEAVKIWIRLLAPFAPYTCEEIWSKTGETGFISISEWPKVNTKLLDLTSEEKENFIIDLIGDTLNILKATKIAPKRVCIYTATVWKWQIYLKLLERSSAGELKIGEVLRDFAADATLKPHMKEVSSLVPRVIKAFTKLPTERKTNLLKIGVLDELKIVEDALGFLSGRFNAEVKVFTEDDITRYDPKGRAGMALPEQPAIFIE
uniref:Leucine--tRNA ligase n=1 Tax=uncultured crenarchaeote MCG TaxID=529375 RepID=B2YI69_9CREN|nr:putative leucyl-tRNA synthetase [uncultured crenarchaeote MCG]